MNAPPCCPKDIIIKSFYLVWVKHGTLLLLILFALAQTHSYSQELKKSNQIILTEKTIVKDSSGMIYPYATWRQLLSTGGYKIRPVDPNDKKTEFLLVRLTEEQKEQQMANAPQPPGSTAFRNGTPISSFTAKDLKGNKYKLKELTGKIVVLNFWFINCGPCRAEIPELNKLVDEYKDSSNIVFLAIALDRKYELEEFLSKSPYNYNIIDDGRYIARQYNVNAYPTHVIIDPQGKIFFHTQGFGMSTIHWLRKSIKELL